MAAAAEATDEVALQELLLTHVHSLIYPDEVDGMTELPVETVMALLGPYLGEERAREMLIDIFWLLDLQTEENPAARGRLASLLHHLIHQGHHEQPLMPVSLLLERLEADLLEMAQVVSSAQAFNRRLAKINTALYYKQARFNLWWEEAEGFSQLVSTLYLYPLSWDKSYDKEEKQSMLERLAERITKLIGFYDLDPFRVMDLTVEVLGLRLGQAIAHQQHHLIQTIEDALKALMHTLRATSRTLAPILGLRLEYRRGNRHEVTNEENNNVYGREFDIMRVIARLIKWKFLDLADILSHMETHEETDKWIRETLQLIATGTLPLRSAGDTVAIVGKSSEAASSIMADNSPPDLHEALYSLLDGQANINTNCMDGIPIPIPPNQRAQLTAATLELGEWEMATSSFLLLGWPTMVEASPLVRSLLSQSIYQRLQSHAPVDETMLEQLLLLLGATGLAWNVSLFWWIVNRLPSFSKDTTLNLLHAIVLPSLSLLPSPNPALVYAIWEKGLGHLPFSLRHTLYDAWHQRGISLDNQPSDMNDLAKTIPECRFARNLIVGRVRRVMRRLTKENVRQYGRLLAKLAHSHPTVVLELIVEQVQAYDNLVLPVVEALKYLTPLGFDVLGWTLVRALGSSPLRGEHQSLRSRLKEDGTSVAGWLQSLATFAGVLYRRYWSLGDVRALLHFLANRLGCTSSNEVVEFSSCELTVLGELLRCMGGIEPLLNATDRRIEALAGGPLLRAEISQTEGGSLEILNTSGSKRKSNVAAKLVEVLMETGLALPLWLALGQQRQQAVYPDQHEESSNRFAEMEEYTHVKVMGLMVDAGYIALRQYTELISRARREGWISNNALLEENSLLAIPINELVEEYGVPYDVVTLIYRTLGRPLFSEASPTMAVTECELFDRLFWSLDVPDVQEAGPRYTQETMRLKGILSSPLTSNSASAMDAAELARLKRDRERAPSTILALEAEALQCQERLNQSIQRILHTPTTSNGSMIGDDNSFAKGMWNVERLFWNCILPRAIQSPGDAIFSARFLLLFMQRRGPSIMANESSATVNDSDSAVTKGSLTNYLPFWTLMESQIVGRMREVLGMLTEWEAHNYGRFLQVLLAEFQTWLEDESDWEARLRNLPSLAIRNPEKIEVEELTQKIEVTMEIDEDSQTNPSSTEQILSTTTMEQTLSSDITPRQNLPITATQTLSHKEVRQQWYKWQLKLHRAFLASLDSRPQRPTWGPAKTMNESVETTGQGNNQSLEDEQYHSATTMSSDEGEAAYLPIRNSLIILTRLTSANLFPILQGMASSLLRSVTRLRDQERRREDLRVMATRYGAVLKMAGTTIPGGWRKEQEFVLSSEGISTLAIEEEKDGADEVDFEQGELMTEIQKTEEGTRKRKVPPSLSMVVDGEDSITRPSQEVELSGSEGGSKRSRRDSPLNSVESSPKRRDRERERDRDRGRERERERERGKVDSERRRDLEPSERRDYQQPPNQQSREGESRPEKEKERDRGRELRSRDSDRVREREVIADRERTEVSYRGRENNNDYHHHYHESSREARDYKESGRRIIQSSQRSHQSEISSPVLTPSTHSRLRDHVRTRGDGQSSRWATLGNAEERDHFRGERELVRERDQWERGFNEDTGRRSSSINAHGINSTLSSTTTTTTAATNNSGGVRRNVTSRSNDYSYSSNSSARNDDEARKARRSLRR